MAGRIRSIRPELIATHRFAARSDAAARLFVGMYSLADDLGNLPAGPTYLAGQIFYNPRLRSAIAIGKLLAELEAARLVVRYVVDGAPFASIVGWSEKDAPTYQLIDKPQPARFPTPRSFYSWNEFDARREGSREEPKGTLSAPPTATAPLGPDSLRLPPGGPWTRTLAIAHQRVAASELGWLDVQRCLNKLERKGHREDLTGEGWMLLEWPGGKKPKNKPEKAPHDLKAARKPRALQEGNTETVDPAARSSRLPVVEYVNEAIDLGEWVPDGFWATPAALSNDAAAAPQWHCFHGSEYVNDRDEASLLSLMQMQGGFWTRVCQRHALGLFPDALVSARPRQFSPLDDGPVGGAS